MPESRTSGWVVCRAEMRRKRERRRMRRFRKSLEWMSWVRVEVEGERGGGGR